MKKGEPETVLLFHFNKPEKKRQKSSLERTKKCRNRVKNDRVFKAEVYVRVINKTLCISSENISCMNKFY